jgi:SAM-dependent methyltransferase
MGVATQYWPSAMLLAAVRLDLFSLIPAEGIASPALARKCGCSRRHLELLLNALSAHEFLEKRGELYFNAADSALYLRRESPAYLGGALAFAQDLYAPWGNLDETMRAGSPASPARHLGTGPEETARFVRAMHERALAMGPALLAGFDLDGARTLLDLGGGPGTLSLLLCRRQDGLRATVLDLPPVAEQARLLLSEQGAGPEIRVVAGSYLDDLDAALEGARFDAVLLSGQMHQESPEDCLRILAGARDRLNDRGRLYLVDIMTDEGKASPRFATLFGINMSLMRPNGGVHSRADMAGCLARSGFRVIREGQVPLDYPYAWFLAAKA